MAISDLFRRRRAPSGPAADPADLDHFRRWCETRVGIDGFLEPATLVDPVGLCLVSFDGEWTRRAAGDERTARRLCDELGVPLFDVLETGYPDRMREFDRVRINRERRARAERLREARRRLDEDGPAGEAPR